jgi:hypothetical protein
MPRAVQFVSPGEKQAVVSENELWNNPELTDFRNLVDRL